MPCRYDSSGMPGITAMYRTIGLFFCYHSQIGSQEADLGAGDGVHVENDETNPGLAVEGPLRVRRERTRAHLIAGVAKRTRAMAWAPAGCPH